MELKPGSKRTEEGQIPGEWEVCTIQEMIDRNAVLGHLDGNHGELYPRSYEFRDYGVPYITANDLEGRAVNLTHCKFLTEERARRFRKGIAKNGDVLFAHNATVGPTALLYTNFDYVILSTTATYFRCNPELLDNSFFLYVLQSPSFVRQYQRVMSQSTRNQVPITAQRKLSVVLPCSIAEQRAIAEALSDADDLTNAIDQLIAKKRDLKRAAMQQLLTGKQRLPGFHEKWEVRVLSDLGDFSKGMGIRKDEVVTDGVPCIRYGEIYTRHNDYIREFFSFLRPETAKQSKRLLKGDLLFAGSGETAEEIGKCVAYLGDEEAYAGGDIVIFSPSNQDSMYLGYLMNESSISGQKARMGQGDAVVHISARNLGQLRFCLPPLKEQKAIATVLSEMDAELAALEQKRDKTRALKQGMMQELLTGKTRLV